MAKADDLGKMLDLEDAANKGWERGLHGILDDLEKKCEGTLKPRGHWPIPGNSDDAYEYLNDYEDSSEAALEPDDGTVRTSEVLNLVVEIRSNRESLENGTAELDANSFGYWVFALGLFANELTFASQRILAFSAVRRNEAGVRGNKSPERLDPIKERNEGILRVARELLALGRERHDLPALFAKKYANKPDYPSSKRQYQTILKGLDK